MNEGRPWLRERVKGVRPMVSKKSRVEFVTEKVYQSNCGETLLSTEKTNVKVWKNPHMESRKRNDWF